jgi:hypothetical protein
LSKRFQLSLGVSFFIDSSEDQFNFGDEDVIKSVEKSAILALWGISIGYVVGHAVFDPCVGRSSYVTDDEYYLALVSVELTGVPKYIKEILIKEGLKSSSFSFKDIGDADLGAVALVLDSCLNIDD